MLKEEEVLEGVVVEEEQILLGVITKSNKSYSNSRTCHNFSKGVERRWLRQNT